MHAGDAAVNLYVSRRTHIIVDMAAQGLRSKDLTVTRNSSHPTTHLVIINSNIRIVWDLTKTILMIATSSDGLFDERLNNASYEMVKTTTVLSQRLQVVLAHFLGTEQERMDKLGEITNTGNMLIQIYRGSSGV